MDAIALDRLVTARNNRRLSLEDRHLARTEARENKAEKLIGQLVRDGRTVFYINKTDRNGSFTGQTIEGTQSYLTDYLVRNRYV
jgi:hypothetical protein